MKKLLLFALAAGIGVSAITKHTVNLNSQAATGSRGEITQIPIGKSGYIWSASDSKTTCLSYNPGLNTIAFTHRGEAGMYPGTSPSTIMASWSTDGGATFPNNMVIADDSHNNRYPSGVLFNPPGNTDPSQAYIVAAGPSHTNGNWDNTYFASQRLDKTNANIEYFPMEGSTQANPFIRVVINDMCITNDGNAYIAGQAYNLEGEVASEYDLTVYKGTKADNDTWTWERNVERIDFYATSSGNENFWLGAGLAFAKDGSIGYKWAIGRKAGLDGGLQPVLFYTEDAGTTWTEIPVNFADNPVMSQYLLASDNLEGPVWPAFSSEIDAVVDANGHLQMFAEVNSQFSTNPDDFNSIFQQKNKLFNITFDKNEGIQNVIFIDSLIGRDINKNSAGDLCFGSGDNATGWNNRLQASISEDGQYIAVSWGDTKLADQDFEGFNGSPDLKGTGRHINAPYFYKIGEEPNAEVPNFTENDLYTGNYRYTYAARIGKKLDNYGDVPHLLVPMSGTVNILEWEANNALEPVSNYLISVDGLGGVPIPLTEGVAEIATPENSFTVSQNQPNPFTGTTTITVNSNTIAPVSVEVSNIMGQTVFTQNEGTINGSKQITIDASNLQAGIYFYTVRVGAESQTKKMMVK